MQPEGPVYWVAPLLFVGKDFFYYPPKNFA